MLVIWLQGIWLPLHGYDYEVTPLWAGIYMIPLLIGFLLMGPLSGWLSDRFGARPFSTLGMLWLTQLGQHSGYASLVGPLLVFGLGNGLAFVPLTSAALEGVDPKDAGAASGLVNVMQQLGGSLGLAVLVTVFGSASSSAQADLPSGLTQAEAVRRVYVQAADTSFWAATGFLAATWLLVTVVMRPRRPRVASVEEPQLVSILD